MNKITITIILAALCLPAFAQEVKTNEQTEKPKVVHHEDFAKKPQKHVTKERKEQEKKLKAMQEKMKVLVNEYKTAKSDKKKEEKKAEILAVVESIRTEQLKMKEEQLAHFAERLAKMQKELEEQKKVEIKQDWVNTKTDELIAADGDLKTLFEKKEKVENKGHRKPGNPQHNKPQNLTSKTDNNK